MRAPLAFLLWSVLIAGGLRQLLTYETTAGTQGVPLAEWPNEGPARLDPAKTNLVMLVHPQCFCSRASLTELLSIMTQAGSALSASVLVHAEPGESASGSALWKSAAAIPGVRVAEDPGGMWAKRFGAKTSGYVVLFDRDGELIFRGGITGARGHVGSNAGEDAVVDLALGRTASLTTAPVFGCPLTDPTSDPQGDRDR